MTDSYMHLGKQYYTFFSVLSVLLLGLRMANTEKYVTVISIGLRTITNIVFARKPDYSMHSADFQ